MKMCVRYYKWVKYARGLRATTISHLFYNAPFYAYFQSTKRHTLCARATKKWLYLFVITMYTNLLCIYIYTYIVNAKVLSRQRIAVLHVFALSDPHEYAGLYLCKYLFEYQLERLFEYPVEYPYECSRVTEWPCVSVRKSNRNFIIV